MSKNNKSFSEKIGTDVSKRGNSKHDADCERGKELIKQLEECDLNVNQKHILLHELREILKRKAPACIASVGILVNLKPEDVAGLILGVLDNDIANHKKKGNGKRINFNFSYLCTVTKRIAFSEICRELEITEGQYYIVILVKRISELYNIPINEYNAYKFTRLIAYDQPSAMPSSTKVLKAIEFIKTDKLATLYRQSE